MMTSLKRKHSGDEPHLLSSYPVQRQSVLDISLVKLTACEAVRREPSLRRSVLIFNTLRLIESELLQEGETVHQCSTQPSILPAIESGDDLTLDVLSTDSGSVVKTWTRSCGHPWEATDNRGGATADVVMMTDHVAAAPHIEMDVFADLDMTMFDIDLIAPLASRLTPLSAEELMHVLPSSDAFSALTGATPCNYKHELLGDDLDHIMQVLVSI